MFQHFPKRLVGNAALIIDLPRDSVATFFDVAKANKIVNFRFWCVAFAKNANQS